MAAATPCRLAKSIVHTFPSSGDADQNPYVFDVCSNGAGLLAVSACGPGHVIKVYDQDALTCVSQLPGHTAKVNELGFAPADSNGLFSASSDGSLRLWDLRAPSLQVHTFKTGGKEVWSASMSSDSTFVAGGVATALRTWDLRTRKMFRSYVDAHTDDVTCVRAHPLLPSVFLTGSEDGLMCAVNNACPDIDDALEAVINVNVAISRIGFVGTEAKQVYALSNIHGLQLWDLGAEELLVDVNDMRPACATAAAMDFDYLIDCKYHAATDRLLLVAGADSGQFGVFHLVPDLGPAAIATAGHAQGHSQVVRGFEWDVDRGQLWSGGEDCKVCLWQVGDERHDAHCDGSGAAVGGALRGKEDVKRGAHGQDESYYVAKAEPQQDWTAEEVAALNRSYEVPVLACARDGV